MLYQLRSKKHEFIKPWAMNCGHLSNDTINVPIHVYLLKLNPSKNFESTDRAEVDFKKRMLIMS